MAANHLPANVLGVQTTLYLSAALNAFASLGLRRALPSEVWSDVPPPIHNRGAA